MSRGYACIGLSNPKSLVNVGSVLRAAHCFDCSLVLIQGKRYKKTLTDTPRYYRHSPLLQVNDLIENTPYDCVRVAVEITDDARDIRKYIHPERAMYIFGPEDSSLGRNTLSRCRDVIKIPTVQCLNLAMTVNVVLYDRLLKEQRK